MVSQGGPCSLVPFQNCPMFPCSNTLSECFRTVIFRILFPCSQKLANVPFFLSIFFPCSLVPKNPGRPSRIQWNTNTVDVVALKVKVSKLFQAIYQTYKTYSSQMKQSYRFERFRPSTVDDIPVQLRYREFKDTRQAPILLFASM